MFSLTMLTMMLSTSLGEKNYIKSFLPEITERTERDTKDANKDGNSFLNLSNDECSNVLVGKNKAFKYFAIAAFVFIMLFCLN